MEKNLVACYCRVSTEEQAKFGFSIDAQKTALTNFCKEHNYKFDMYVDEGISASSMRRPDLQKMLNKSYSYKMILFTKLDRLSRNVKDANDIVSILSKNNCSIKAIDEDDIDTTTADGMFMFNLKMSLAQREIGKTSERINFVFNDKRTKGEVTSGKKKYGYDIVDKKYTINKKEVDNIISFFEYFVSINGNCTKAYDYYVLYFPHKSYSSMTRMLREKSFIGLHKLKNKDVYLENYVTRIMSDELFNKVQSLLIHKQPRESRINAFYMFSGLIYCDKCKKRMVSRYGLYKKDGKKTDSEYHYYLCPRPYKPNVKTPNCDSRTTIREEDIEKYLVENLRKEFENYKVNITVKSERKVDFNEVAILERKLKKLKELYLDDLISKEDYKKDYDNLNSKIATLKEETDLETKIDLSNTERLLNSTWNIVYESLSSDNKRRFWLSVLDKVYVNDGHIVSLVFK